MAGLRAPFLRPLSLFLFLLFFGGACARVNKEAILSSIEKSPDAYAAFMIKDVPHFPQSKLLCGPSSVASVLNYYGAKVSMEEVAEKVYNEDLKGTLSIDLLIYAKEKGFSTSYYSGGLEDLKQKIRDKTPPVVFLNLGFKIYPVGHFIVVTGYSEKEKVIVAHSGAEKDKVMGYGDFINAWEKTGFSTLLITPKK
ncbi:MAG TPA: C39 family peptidase [Thermodesulfobacteriota bacterium]|nr:C39 family peptidase [Thermodesulfobacteriota bacterium]